MIEAEVYDPQRALTEDWKTYFVENRDRPFIIPCAEGPVEMMGNWALINIMLAMPLIRRGHPISRDLHMHLDPKVAYGAKLHAEIETRVSRTLEAAGYTREELGEDIILTMQDAHNMCYTHFGSYIRTMDIFSIADTVLQDEVAPICTPDYGDLEDGNIKRMEQAFKEQSQRVDDVFMRTDLTYNVFRAPLMTGALRNQQFHQFVFSAGPRSDIDEHMFRRPVVGSFLSGYRDISDFGTESRSAAKAYYMAKTQMANTSYRSRKVHLQNSVMWHLYKGECGAVVYLEYEPTKRTAKFFKGKFFLDHQGRLVELTEERYGDVVGKPTLFRTVTACRWLDGYCQTCGGTITQSFSPVGNVGILSNVNTGSPVSQKVLSAKHLTTTISMEYDIPYVLRDWLDADANDIYLHPSVRHLMSTMAFGFQPNDIARVNDLKYAENAQSAQYFSAIKNLTIGVLKEDGSIKPTVTRINMKDKTGVYPHLSSEMLDTIRTHPADKIRQDGLEWVLLRNLKPEFPVMQCTVINNSVKRFVDKFNDLINARIENYTSMTMAMKVVSELIWSQVDTHITHIECLVRACMITSKKDFHIPLMEDPENVMFGGLGKNMPMRSIGALMAFERIDLATIKPVTYITAKRHGMYDEYLGPIDVQERDKAWPPFTDQLTEELSL